MYMQMEKNAGLYIDWCQIGKFSICYISSSIFWVKGGKCLTGAILRCGFHAHGNAKSKWPLGHCSTL